MKKKVRIYENITPAGIFTKHRYYYFFVLENKLFGKVCNRCVGFISYGLLQKDEKDEFEVELEKNYNLDMEIEKLLPNYDYITTFYDFYGFSNRPTDNIDELERIIFELFSDRKFIPYIQKYEFETLLFSKPEYFEEYFGNDKIAKEIKKIVDTYNDIELINDSPQTAPHKRFEKLFEIEDQKYDKVFHGEGIAYDIGLSKIRSSAKRFNNWIEKLSKINK